MHTTAWSVVMGAQQTGAQQQEYLERLIKTYWKPAYYYARRRGMDHHGASDCIQEFFARMLAGEWLASVDKNRGRFRGWLLTALRRWVSRNRTATGMDRLTLVNDEVVRAYEQEDAGTNPDELFNKAWARSCLDEAMRLMGEETRGSGREKQVAVFTTYLEQTAERGEAPSYDELGAEFDLPVTSVTNYLHRARTLFRTYLLRVIRDTVGKPEEAELELHELRKYLS
ncbi:MAG: sigma-70 family RNA polymerase sigma factor [Planctomycetota bacterium]|nr:sigma-70 family RNA polymerase sigma factor [Planctomycetota bacterium]